MKVLIAEDDPAQQRLLSHLLRQWGYEPRSVLNGLQAIELLSSKDLSIALVDWDLPGASGLEICQRVRQSGHYLHAIVLTARTDSEDLTVALEAGASDYLVKPFSRNELRARLMVARRMVDLHASVAQMQKLESIGQLAAGVAHEINTPAQFVSDNLRFAADSVSDLSGAIESLRGALRALEEAGTAPELVEKTQGALADADVDFILEELPACLAQSSEGIDRIAGIVRAMKTFSHPGGTGRQEIDLNEAIRSTATVSRSEWKHVADLRLELDPTLPLVSCYPGELNQAVLNLIVNAAHAVDQSRHQGKAMGSIQIVTERVDGGVRVSVGDTGTGVPRAIRDRIFDPFFTTKEVGKGTGQGLSVTYDVIVHKHGGRIWLDSTEGEGTTFYLEIPEFGDDEASPA